MNCSSSCLPASPEQTRHGMHYFLPCTDHCHILIGNMAMVGQQILCMDPTGMSPPSSSEEQKNHSRLFQGANAASHC